MKLYKIIFSFFFLGSAGCTFFITEPTPPPTDVISNTCNDESLDITTASFTVDRVNAKVINVIPNASGIPAQFTLDFEACITDTIKTQGSAVTNSKFHIYTYKPYNEQRLAGITHRSGHKVNFFRIEGDDKRKYLKFEQNTSARDGCLRWQETYNYEKPDKLQWIYFERVFKNNSGARVIPMKVNPYGVQETKFYDLNHYEDIDSASTFENNLFQWHIEDPSSSNTFENPPNTQENINSRVNECLKRRSLSEIFNHLKSKPKAMLYANDIEITTSFEYPTEPTTPVFYEKYNICASHDEEEENDCDVFGSFLNLRLGIPLKIRSEDTLGDIPYDNVKKGDFKVSAFLVARSQTEGSKVENFKLHRKTQTKEASLISGEDILRVRFENLHIPYQSDEATLELYLEISAKQSGSIQPFYGIYNIEKKIKDLDGQTFTGVLKTYDTTHAEPRCSLPSHLQNSSEGLLHLYCEQITNKQKYDLLANEYTRPNKSHKQNFQKARLDLKLNRMRFARVDAHDPNKCESVVERTVTYIGEVCLKDPRKNNAPFANKTLGILSEDIDEDFIKKYNLSRSSSNSLQLATEQDYDSLGNGIVLHETRVTKTNAEGCIFFSYTIKHNPYDRQKYLVKKFIFEPKNSANIEKIVMFNPWESGFLTYQEITQPYERWQESRDFENEEHKNFFEERLTTLTSSKMLEPPILRFHNYRSLSVEPSYEIRSSLDITTVKNIQILSHPVIARFDSIGQTIRARPYVLPKGYYLLRVIIASGPAELYKGNPYMVTKEIHNGITKDDLSFHAVLNNLLSAGLSLNWFRDYMGWSENISQQWDQAKYRTLEYSQPLKQNSGRLNQLKTRYGQIFRDLPSEHQNNTSVIWSHPNLDRTTNADAFSDNPEVQEWCKSFAPNCTPSFTKEDYIDHFDTVAYSEGGALSIFTPQKFTVENFRRMASKNAIIFQLFPTQPAHYVYEEGSCEINVKKSKFLPYPAKTDESKNCDFDPTAKFKDDLPEDQWHELISPPHWGIFSSASHASHSPLRPISEDQICELSKKAGIIGDVEIFTANQSQAKAFKNISQEVSKEDNSQNLETEIQKILKNQNYCEVITSDTQACICELQTTEEEGSVISENSVKNCLLYAGKPTTDNSSIRIAEVQDYCNNTKRDSAEQDEWSPDPAGDKFRQCVCNNDDANELTHTIARCFSQDQGLRLILDDSSQEDKSTSQFLEDLNAGVDFHKKFPNLLRGSNTIEHPLDYRSYNDTYTLSSDKKVLRKFGNLPQLQTISPEALTRIVENGSFFNPGMYDENSYPSSNNIYDPETGSFLHLMCYFWFQRYFENYVDSSLVGRFHENVQNNLSLLSLQGLMEEEPEQSFANTQEQAEFKKYMARQRELEEELSEQGLVNSETPDWLSPRPFVQHQNKHDFGFRANMSSQVPYHLGPKPHPYLRCMKNPLYFFHFEKKVIVSDLNRDNTAHDYKNGNIFALSTRHGIGIGGRLERSLRHSLSIGSRARISPTFTKDWWIGPSLDFGAEISKTETDSVSDYINVDQNRTIMTAVNHIQVQLSLSEYRQCLLIRPKSFAFEGYGNSIWNEDLREAHAGEKWLYQNVGLLICSQKNTNPLEVQEDYYYIHQFFAGHPNEFISRSMLQNRPYTGIFRGKNALDKFIVLSNASVKADISTYDRESIFQDTGHFDHNLISAYKDMSLNNTGFYEGIYTDTDPKTHYLYFKDDIVLEEKREAFSDRLMDVLQSIDAIKAPTLNP